LLVLLTEGSSIKVRVFHEREDAAQWLGVRVELLAGKRVGEHPEGTEEIKETK